MAMSKKSSESKNEDQNIEISNHENFDILNFETPEISSQSEAYHDSDELAKISDSAALPGQESADSDTDDIERDAVTLSRNDEAATFLEDEREKARGLLDDKEKPYDPAMHVFPPEKTPSGIWKKLPKSQREKKDPETGKTVLPTKTNLSCRRDAEKSARFYDTIHCVVFGAEAKATSEQVGALTDSFERFYQENGAIEIPPHVELALTCLDHTTEIIKRPSVTEKFKLLMVKTYFTFNGFFGKKKRKPIFGSNETEQEKDEKEAENNA